MKKMKELQKAEEDEPLLSSIPHGGHFLTEYPHSYLPIVVEMFDKHSTITSILDTLPPPTPAQKEKPIYLQREPKKNVREQVNEKIRNAAPGMFQRFSPLHNLLKAYPGVKRIKK